MGEKPASPRPPDELIGGHDLHKTYGKTEVLRGVDISVQRGEKICIVGPSGSGKSTLLRCLNLLVAPTKGELWFEGGCIGRWPASGNNEALQQPQAARRWRQAKLPIDSRGRVDVRAFRSRVGMVFQHFELFPHLSVWANVALGPRHVLDIGKEEARDRALKVLDRVGLARFADAKPRSLSGGQQQRVAIARALAMEPAAILMDEPTSALDWEMVQEVLDIMTTLAEAGMTMIVVTHELEFARQTADYIIVMEDGRIIEEGPTRQMFETPKLDRTRQILGG